MSIWEVAAAGSLSAIPATLLVAPAERIKCLIQVSSGAETTTQGSLVQAWRRAGGIRGLYTGTLATLLRDSPGAAAYFATYHSFKRILSENAPPSPLSIMFAGGLAGMANWIVAIVSLFLCALIAKAGRRNQVSAAGCWCWRNYEFSGNLPYASSSRRGARLVSGPYPRSFKGFPCQCSMLLRYFRVRLPSDFFRNRSFAILYGS